MSAAYLGHAACYCYGRAVCGTCAGFNVIFDAVAERRADAVERALQSRLIKLALDQQQARRRPVRDLPRRLRIDLDALADAVALRLRRPA